MMDDSNLIRYYVEKSKEWIFQNPNNNYRIEDDEILDLDSLSLDSNEDTWLYSSDEKSSRSTSDTTFDNTDVASSPISSSNFANEVIEFKTDCSCSISSMSPLIDAHNWSDSLIHIPDVSPATIDNYLVRTPMDENKAKSYLRTALSNQFHSNYPNVENKVDTDSSASKIKTDCNTFPNYSNILTPSNELEKLATKKPYTTNNNDNNADKSYVLHSVENKLFALTEADANDAFNFHYKTNQNREYALNDLVKKSDMTRKTDCAKSNSSVYKAADFSSNKECDRKFWSNKVVKVDPLRNAALKTCENDENDHRSPSKKYVPPICQSTPMLLNRYLKYNKSIDDSKNYAKWRTSAEFLKEDTNKMEYPIEKNELNVSYVKHTSSDSIENYISPQVDENDETNSNLNTTYSKSECLLNSTYDVHDEDDRISSASESSASSLSNKPFKTIGDVRKMAQLQERSLQKQIHSHGGAASSKSSEISSSNESISAFSPLSSSNEGQIDLKTNYGFSNSQRSIPTNRKPFTSDTLMYSSQTTNIRNTKSAGTQQELSKEEKFAENLPTRMPINNNTFKYEPSLVNGDSLLSPENIRKLNKNEQNLRNISFTGRSPIKKTASKEYISAAVKSKSTTDNKLNLTHTAFVSKLSMVKTAEHSDLSSAKECRTRDDQRKMIPPHRSVSPGPVSHIPRPSSRIPKLRTSASCTRYGRNSPSSLNK